FVLFSLLSLALCALHSFPTRRSSDLHLLRRILILQMIDSIRTAEVRNITLRRHSCAAEKNDPAAVVYDLLKLFCLFLIHSFPPPSIFQKGSFFNMPVENLLHLLPDDL